VSQIPDIAPTIENDGGILRYGEEKPTFTMKKLSWANEREYGFARNKILVGNFTAEDNEKWVITLTKTLSLAVVSVPRGWLVEDAPLEIDWSKPESFDYLVWGGIDRLHTAFMAYRESLQKK